MVRIKILAKLLIFFVLTFLISFGLIYSVYFVTFNNYSSFVKKNADELLIDKYRYGLKNTTEVAVTLINTIMNLENLTAQEKIQLARKLVRPLRYGKDGYYFVYEKGTGVNVIHGDIQGHEGKNLWYLTDEQETQYIIQELDRVAEQKTLFHEYYWTKPGSEGQYPKLGTAMMIPDTNMWVGTGEYIDDINESRLTLSGSIDSITNTTRTTIIVILACIMTVIIFITFILSRQITLPIKNLISSTKKISEGNYDISVKILTHDEIGELAKLFNEMAQTIKDYTENLEKKVYDRTAKLQETMDKLNQTNKILESLSEKLSRYLPPQIKENILSGKHEVEISSKRKKLTVFFSDIKNFTQTTSRMETEALTELINNYLDEMARIALTYGGTIDKYIGDAILIFYGDPETKGFKNDAIAAVSMAIEMRNRIQVLQKKWLDHGIAEPFHVRMGINTGYCTVGNFGSNDRMDYTIIGSQVNLASRLESAASQDQIIISHETYTLIREKIFCRKKDVVHVKGIDYPVQTYEVVDFHENIEEKKRKIHENIEGFNVEADLGQINEKNKISILKALKKAFDTIKGI